MSSTPGIEATNSKPHIKAVLQALLVTFLWSTSWVLIKMGLQAKLPAVTFAGLRYFTAFMCLVPLVLINPAHRSAIRNMPRTTWGLLISLGLVFYTLTQGAQFVSLAYLPAATLTLLLNFSVVVVALLSGFVNKESPSMLQWGGVLLSVAGAVVYFLPLNIPAGQTFGLAVALVGVLANAGGALLGRQVNQHSGLPPIVITTISMGIGGTILLIGGATMQGFGELDAKQWLIIGWLAVVNTAFAFTLWNKTLQTLTAFEASILNNTMLPQIAILAWLFLDEPLSWKQVIGIALVGVGTLVVQARR
ncbi:MAG: EamA family transporter [Anaerolineae bacterium]|nr:EamA family transporter [Anaerolineae bacterium]